jgi:hypothetical protein
MITGRFEVRCERCGSTELVVRDHDNNDVIMPPTWYVLRLHRSMDHKMPIDLCGPCGAAVQAVLQKKS